MAAAEYKIDHMTGSVIGEIISNEGPVSSVLSRVRSIGSFLFALILHSSNRHRATESLRQSCQSANRMGSPDCACSKNSGIHTSLDMKIDRRIREIRGFYITQAEFAKRIGVSQGHLSYT